MMVTLGAVTAVVMGRFDALQLHQPAPAFLSVSFFDITSFGTLLGLAIVWRTKPELHRRFLVLATCCLLSAAFGRFDYLFNHSLFYVCVDLVMLLGVARDLLVDRRVHKVYLYGIPAVVIGQNGRSISGTVRLGGGSRVARRFLAFDCSRFARMHTSQNRDMGHPILWSQLGVATRPNRPHYPLI
jgi:hypothetical protein